MNRYSIKRSGKDVLITEWGDSNNPVIFCLHGLGSTSLSFIEVAEELKDSFHVIAVDAPGHGKSDSLDREEDYEMPAMTEWLDDVITTLGIEQFYILSHSWGSFVALFYLNAHSEKILGSILLDGGYQSKRESPQTMEEEAAYYERDFEDYMETWEDFKEQAVYGAVTRRSELLDRAAEDLLLLKDGKYYWHARGNTGSSIVKAMHKHESSDLYDDLPAGTILLRATLPENREEQRKRMAENFRQRARGTVIDVPHVTHMLHWDNPHYIIDVIKQNWM